MIEETLVSFWFSKKEIAIYVATLELWGAAVSTISAKSWEHRVSTYSLLKELKKRWIANEITKNNIKYYSVISPQELLKREKSKIDKLNDILPELIALWNSHAQKSKVYFYEWKDRLKELFWEIVDEGDTLREPFLSFLWTTNIDSDFEKYLLSWFVDHRSAQSHPTKVIIADLSSQYAQKNQEMHDAIVIEDAIFDMWNEIVIYWEKVAILSYNKDEIYGLVIESKILSSALKSMFNLIWKLHKK